MQVIITNQFKRPANPDINVLIHQLSLLHAEGKEMPKGISVIATDTPLQVLAANHKGEHLYVELFSAYEIEDAFRYYFTGTARYRGLLHDVYKFNPNAVFGKYLKDSSVLNGNTYLDETVHNHWKAWIKEYKSQYAYYSLLDNQQ